MPHWFPFEFVLGYIRQTTNGAIAGPCFHVAVPGDNLAATVFADGSGQVGNGLKALLAVGFAPPSNRLWLSRVLAMVCLQIVNAGFFTALWDGLFGHGALCCPEGFPESCFPKACHAEHGFHVRGVGAVAGVSRDGCVG